ncbi:pilin assembly protein [Pseudomonas sp. MAP12]|uniref:Pilin assembly protein n=1 Tax=Geopseudomonas aromaticivorans TaxID=2849492 RepID=A0ABS6MWS8_9GAMM|nr:pilin assembly protein [Pseudomonas aromaticivorans]MBV2132821.1 pilin assembly protein [Pseudomonas aromaticivorans]
MKIRDLVNEWELSAKGALSKSTYCIPLDLESAARLAALREMYPRRSTEELLGGLVGAALQELEESFAYVKGSKVVATDEQGDPLYEDIGLTPRFLALARKHRQELSQSDDDDF